MGVMNHSPPDDGPLAWPEEEREVLGRYNIFDLERSHRRSPTTGRLHRFLRLQSPDWVNIIAVTAEGDCVLVEQYRHGTNQTTLEIPGGAVDPGESPREAAARELEEETGFRPGRMVELGSVEPNPAFLSNACWTYLALDCREDGRVQPDPSEDIVVRRVPWREFTRLIDDGAITHSLVIAAHDHLQRGIRRNEPWLADLTGAGNVDR
jgi:8-oxo-dGTP pyrophosphatase MutT (NUDIX family)